MSSRIREPTHTPSHCHAATHTHPLTWCLTHPSAMCVRRSKRRLPRPPARPAQRPCRACRPCRGVTMQALLSPAVPRSLQRRLRGCRAA
eukprot:7389675-Prymnesium_polylepis.1